MGGGGGAWGHSTDDSKYMSYPLTRLFFFAGGGGVAGGGGGGWAQGGRGRRAVIVRMTQSTCICLTRFILYVYEKPHFSKNRLVQVIRINEYKKSKCSI